SPAKGWDMRLHWPWVALLLLVAACTSSPTATERHELSGTSWRLVRFEGGDGKVLAPTDRSRYTLAFGSDGAASLRIDCNRGTATWSSPERQSLRFGPLKLTRAMCAPGSLHDHIVKQWPYVRTYVFRDGHLFLALMADGGIYEFEPEP